MNELTIEARIENLEKVLEFVNERLEMIGCSMKAIMQINIAVEEIFVNVSQYAYQEDKMNGTDNVAIIRVQDGKDPLHVCVSIADRGLPFNPLAKADPDVTLSAQERKIGGLGSTWPRRAWMIYSMSTVTARIS